jgi:tRNA (cytidine/uridine-2'-O-)-methyltransferase
MRIALYQPDIAGNVGAIMRLCACFGVPVDIIMPVGFVFSDKALKRSAMDYGDVADLTRHASPAHFFESIAQEGRRIILLSSAGDTSLPHARFTPNDTLLLGSESKGVPADVHDRADMRVRIPMRAGFRSLNIAVSAGIALSEALRQTGSYPE